MSYPDMASNVSIWDVLEDSPVIKHGTTPVPGPDPHAQWAGVGTGSGVFLVALITIAVLVKRNLEAVERVLDRLQTCLTAATQWLRRDRVNAATSPNPVRPDTVIEIRNLSDSQRIGIREMARLDCPPQPQWI